MIPRRYYRDTEVGRWGVGFLELRLRLPEVVGDPEGGGSMYRGKRLGGAWGVVGGDEGEARVDWVIRAVDPGGNHGAVWCGGFGGKEDVI